MSFYENFGSKWISEFIYAALQLFRSGSLLGTTLLPNLTLNMGNNSLVAQGQFSVCIMPLNCPRHY